MSLNPGKKIGRYEIISLLGSGGMGEVYLASDTQLLGRQVAVKILKHSGDETRLQRFKLEARAISSLNHPNILSIYEFGQFEDIHFIATEFVNGDTLRRLMSEGRLDLTAAIETAIQIGNALVVAHHAGIFHRDIKPENVMVLPDGYVKVLDFGLAKLRTSDDIFSAQQQSTVSLLETTPGTMIGTVHYMSPEQLRGRSIDHQTDLWSLGAVLYEMVTGSRPFSGDSVSDVIAAILERPVVYPPEPSSEILPELRDILERALAKDKQKRYATAKDLVTDLKVVKQLLNSGLSSGSNARSRSVSVEDFQTPVKLAAFKGSKLSWLAALMLLVVLTAGGGWVFRDRIFAEKPVAGQLRSRPLSTSGNVLNAVLSPDGRFIAYVQSDSGQQSLRLRQVAQNADSVLIPAANADYAGLQFSPDSESVYYTVFAGTPTGVLFRKPILGGTPQKLVEDVDSAISFSPKGERLVFIRTRSHEGVDQLIVASSDGGEVSVLAERKYPAHYSLNNRESPAWSPDGKTIACPAGLQDASGEKMSIVEIDAATGDEKPATSGSWSRVGKVIWAKGGDDLIFTAADFGNDLLQVFRLSRSTGRTERITNETNDYLNVSISSDSRYMLGISDDRGAHIYVADTASPSKTTPIAGGNLDGIRGLSWTPDGSLLYVSMANGNRDIWIMKGDGSDPKPLTFDRASDDYPSISNDGKHIVFVSSRSMAPHIWRMDADGGNPVQLTNQSGEAFPQISGDGTSVFYRIKPPLAIWSVPVEGGEPHKVAGTPSNWFALSPDGTKLAGLTMSPSQPMRLSIFSRQDGALLKTFDLEGDAGNPAFPPVLRWTPLGDGLAYISTERGVSNIVVQGLGDRLPRKLTEFSADRIFSFDWSRDGRKIAFSRGTAHNQLLLFENF